MEKVKNFIKKFKKFPKFLKKEYVLAGTALLITVCFLLYLGIIAKKSKSPRIQLVTKLEYLLLNAEQAEQVEAANYAALEGNNEGKDLKDLINISEEIKVPFTRDGVSLNLDEERDFSFFKEIDEETVVELLYFKNRKTLSLVIPIQEFSLNENKLKTKRAVIYEITEIEPNSILKLAANETINLSQYKNDKKITLGDLFSRTIQEYKLSNENLLNSNIASFESTIWQEEAKDCSSKAEGKAALDLSASGDATDGTHSLKLASSNHTACVSHNFPLKIDRKNFYKISFDYKNVKGEDLKYQYIISDKNKKQVKKAALIKAPDNNWNHLEEVIDFKNISTPDSLLFYFYTPSTNKEVVNLYDNLKVHEYSLKRNIKLTSANIKTTEVKILDELSLSQENHLATVVSEGNLLEKQNYSFENGSWQKKVKDCSTVQKGQALVNMELSDDATQGDQSLKLISKNHDACVSTGFKVNLDIEKKYRLSFDYKSSQGGFAKYYYSLGNKAGQKEPFSQTIAAPNNDWNHFETIIEPKISGINLMNLYFYAPSEGEEVVTLYDNVVLEEVELKDLNSYFLYSKKEIDPKPEMAGYHQNINSRFRSTIVFKGVKEPFVFKTETLFTDAWKIYPLSLKTYSKGENSVLVRLKKIYNQLNYTLLAGFISEPLEETEHFELSGKYNSWQIDPEVICSSGQAACKKNQDGSYDLVLIMENNWSKFFLIFWALALVGVAGIIWALAVKPSLKRKVKKPKVKKPKLPKFNFPKFKFPKITLPKFKLPKIKFPKIRRSAKKPAPNQIFFDKNDFFEINQHEIDQQKDYQGKNKTDSLKIDPEDEAKYFL